MALPTIKTLAFPAILLAAPFQANANNAVKDLPWPFHYDLNANISYSADSNTRALSFACGKWVSIRPLTISIMPKLIIANSTYTGHTKLGAGINLGIKPFVVNNGRGFPAYIDLHLDIVPMTHASRVVTK